MAKAERCHRCARPADRFIAHAQEEGTARLRGMYWCDACVAEAQAFIRLKLKARATGVPLPLCATCGRVDGERIWQGRFVCPECYDRHTAEGHPA